MFICNVQRQPKASGKWRTRKTEEKEQTQYKVNGAENQVMVHRGGYGHGPCIKVFFYDGFEIW
jgi:predicted fused transcriptional regulator/phosphomethylpyrimidine kinase